MDGGKRLEICEEGEVRVGINLFCIKVAMDGRTERVG